MMQEGKIQPSVATSAPASPAILMPTKVAELMAMGPGVIWEMVTRSVNSGMESQPCWSTICPWMRGMAAYPPPKLNSPICKKLQNSCR